MKKLIECFVSMYSMEPNVNKVKVFLFDQWYISMDMHMNKLRENVLTSTKYNKK